ncbi:transposase family protein [Streptomyces sp. NPDC004752]
MRTEGIAEQFRQHRKAKADEGYRCLTNKFPRPGRPPAEEAEGRAPPGDHHAWREQRRRQSSARIHVEHSNAEYKQWRLLQRFTGPRETYPETHLAIAGLVFDRPARRPTRRMPSAEPVLARQAAC